MSSPAVSLPDAQPPRETDLLRTIAAGTAGVTGEAFMQSLVSHVAVAFGAAVAFVAELLDTQPERARVLASHTAGQLLPEGWEFAIGGTPCEGVRENDVVAYPEGTRERFPDDRFVTEHGLDGYLAIALRDSAGKLQGYLGVMSLRRLVATAEEVATLRIFAARAAAELERRRHESALRAREAEVAASRARIVQAADEERRRIGRNLHDGSQQRLVALGQFLDVARMKLEAGAADEALELLVRAREQTGAVGTELRDLARGLHPAGLAEHGLRRSLAGVAAGAPLPLRVDRLPDRRLPDAIEVTLYFLVCEALTNTIKYASASHLRVTIVQHGREIVAEVADDGVGGARADAGSGLDGLAGRIEALGGTLEVDSPAGAGTRLRAAIPLWPWRSPRDPSLEFGYDGDGGEGDELIRQILAGRKTATLSLAREWDLEGGPPRPGQLLPVLDHLGTRRATVEVVSASVMAFGDVDENVLADDSAEARSPDAWRASQRSFYEACREETAILLGEPDWRITDGEPMVITYFRLVADR